MLDHDFTEKYYEIKFFQIMDILAIIGGLNASIGPILGLLIPLLTMNYLYQLAKLIIGKHRYNYSKQLEMLYNDFKRVYEKINVEKIR